MKNQLAGLMKQLGIIPAHIIGSSYGGYIALLLAVDHPKLVRTLVLGEPPAFPLMQHVSNPRTPSSTHRLRI